MKRIALSGWLAYAPFRAAKIELMNLGIEILDSVPDREDGLSDGRYAAAPLSTYSFASEFDRFGDDVGVYLTCVEPVGFGSDRIVVREGIESINDLYHSRIGLRSRGLEISLFEHLFDSANLPRKTDYIFLEERSQYLSAFVDGHVSAVMAPQPDRSKLLRQTPDAELFHGDEELPRYGLYAILAYRRAEWKHGLLGQVHEVVSRKAVELASLTDAQLTEAQPSSFNGIEYPANEIRTTLRWPSVDQSDSYIHGTGDHSFISHLQQTIEFRSRRFGNGIPNPERYAMCVS